MKSIILKRQNLGKAKTRFNILLKGLAPRYQRILFKNPVIKKNSTDDRFILCLFKIEDAKIKVSHLRRPFINLDTREVSDYSSIIKSYKVLDWNCAFCKRSIKTKIDNFKSDNFTCSDCYNYYKIKEAKTVSDLIVSSMFKFVEHYKNILKENQKMFLKYIKKNER